MRKLNTTRLLTGGCLYITGDTIVQAGSNTLPFIDPKVPDMTTYLGTPINFDLTPYENDAESSGTDLAWSVERVNPEKFTASIDLVSDVLTINPVSSSKNLIILKLHDPENAEDSQRISVSILPVTTSTTTTSTTTTTTSSTSTTTVSTTSTSTTTSALLQQVLPPQPQQVLRQQSLVIVLRVAVTTTMSTLAGLS